MALRGLMEEKEEHHSKLLEVYKQEAALEALRSRLRENPSVYLHSAQEVHELLDKLEDTSNKLKEAAERLGRTERPLADEAEEEQKLLLLLWDAKSELYVQAVQLWAERQPLTDSRTIGRRLGTKLSEKIQKAIQSRPEILKDQSVRRPKRGQADVVVDNDGEEAILGVQVDDGEEDSSDPEGAWEDVDEAH
ncbi:hypothetical protein PtA15_15A468 [Puccinia triticina]|uniref:Uncharacterized protein n=1 Tax=Puccinia triticina TaxID=208348 RepID=A0ABY7D720_9BASI|nr:uncharacterized protein PtA15_15A468 [Puccinia triticina]WAQ92072.1 hypothetical protein PtA15_15A468 [Puccinia triticina]